MKELAGSQEHSQSKSRRALPGPGYPPDSVDALLHVVPPPTPESVIPRSVCALCYPSALEVASRLLLSMAMHPRSMREHEIPVRVVDEVRCRHIIIDGIVAHQLAAATGELAVLPARVVPAQLTD